MPIILALLLLVLAGHAEAVTVNTAHPRLFVNPTTLTTIRAQCGTGAQNEDFVTKLRGYVQTVVGQKARYRDHLAYYILTGDNTYQSKQAILARLADVKTAINSNSGSGWESPIADGEGSSLGRASWDAVAVDWLWADLSAADRTLFATCFAKAATKGATQTAFGVSLCADSNCEPWRGTCNRLSFLLVSSGETGNSTTEATTQAAIDEVVQMMEDWAPCKEAIAPHGEQGQYAWVRWGNFTGNYLMLKSATDYTGVLDGMSFMEDGLWYQHRLRPRLWISSKSRYYSTSDPAVDKWNINGQNPLQNAAIQGYLGDPYALNFAKYLRSQGWNYGTNTEAFRGLWPAIYLTSTDAGTAWNTRPKSCWAPNMGWYSGRQTWNFVTDGSDTGVRFSYFGEVYAFNNTATAGHFQMYRGDDNILSRSGWRGSDFDLHYYDWDDAAYGRNCFTIYRAADDIDELRNGWSAGCPTCVIRTRTEKNYGKQEDGDETTGGQELADCVYDPPEDYGPQSPTKRGRLLRYVDDTEFVDIATTNELGQDPDKQDVTARGVQWIKLPGTTGQGFAIVWDRATLKPGVTAARAQFHMVNVPHMNGTITATAGGGSFGGSQPDSIPCDWDGLPGDPWGGVYRSTNTTKAWFDDGNSRGCFYPLYASDELGTTARLYAIGGPNKLGQHWKQTWAPCATETASSNLTSGSSFEFWHSGRNHPPGIYADGSGPPCGATITCADGTTTTRCKIDLEAGGPTYRNDRQNTSNSTSEKEVFNGNGADACDWRLEYGWDNLSISSGTDQVDLISGVWAGPSTVAPGSLPTLYVQKTDDVAAIGYKPNGGTAEVIVVSAPTVSARWTELEYINPLFGSGETGSQDHRILWLGVSRNWEVFGDGVSLGTAYSDASGTLVYSIPATAETITIQRGNIVYPPPTPPPGPVPYTLANTVLYHPRERTLLQAGGGTLVLLYYGEGSYGAPIYAQLSRDDGQTWRDLDGAIDSATELVLDEEAAGPNYYTPRGDYGFSAAIDPTSNDLWIVTPAVRMNGSHVEIASLVRAKLFAWDGVTWSASSSYTYNGSEVALASKPRDCTALVTAGHQLFAAWTGPSGANWSIQSVRIKSGTATALSAGAALASSSQSAQLLEYPRGTVWLLASVRSAATDDSIRVRKATDGGSAQWGTTSRIAFAPQGTLGQWGACVGPSGPWVAAKDVGAARYRFAYWTGSAWTTGLVPVEPTAGTEPSVTAAGVTRVVLTSRYSTSVLRAYWSLSDGWSGWETVATLTGLSYSHVAALRPTDLLAVSARTGGFTATPFSLPAETEPTGACCSGGSCSVQTYEACATVGGTWQGPSVPCTPDPCISSPEVGACCYPDGSCVVTPETGCGGTYQGDRTECSPNPCPSGPPSVAGRRRRLILAAR